MYIFTKDNELYVLNEKNGRLFLVKMGHDGNPIIICQRIFNYHAEVMEMIKDNNAVPVRET